MRICSGAGCLRTVPDGTRYCAEHTTKAQTATAPGSIHVPVSTADRDLYARIYGSQRWKIVRLSALQAHPFCTWPGCHAVAVLVDHIVPLSEAIRQCEQSRRWPYDRDAGAYLLSNLTGMCRVHHGVKTDQDKTHTGPWPDVVAAYDASVKRVWAI